MQNLIYYIFGLLTPIILLVIIVCISNFEERAEARNYSKNYYNLIKEWDDFPEELRQKYRLEFESRDFQESMDKDKYFRLIYIYGFKKLD